MTGPGTTSITLPDFRSSPDGAGQAVGNKSGRRDSSDSVTREQNQPSRYEQVASRHDGDKRSAAKPGTDTRTEGGNGQGAASKPRDGDVSPENNEPAIPVQGQLQQPETDAEWMLLSAAPPELEGVTPGELIRGLAVGLAPATGVTAAAPGTSLNDGAPLLASRETFATLLQSDGELAGGRLTELLNTPVASRTSGALELAGLAQGVPAELRAAEAVAMRGYTTSVPVPVGAAEWGERIMGKLSWLTAQNVSVAEIHITPPELGPLEVRVQVQNEQATVTVHATTPAVREQLEAQSLRLRDMLAEQGIELEGFDVTDSGADGTEADSGTAGGYAGAGDADSGQAAGQEPPLQPALDLSWKGEVDLYV